MGFKTVMPIAVKKYCGHPIKNMKNTDLSLKEEISWIGKNGEIKRVHRIILR
jgi:hypothetical protein